MKVLNFNAVLRFECVDHAEYTSLRATVKNFVDNNNGKVSFKVNEESDSYFAEISMGLPIASKSECSSLMTTIDNALPSLPALSYRTGYGTEYFFTERENGEPSE